MGTSGGAEWIIEARRKVGEPDWKPMDDSAPQTLEACRADAHERAATRGGRPLMFRLRNLRTDAVVNLPVSLMD